MISTKLPKTAQIPSGFAMPVTGAAFGTGTGMTAAAGAGIAPHTCDYIVRDRHVAGASLDQGVVPGPTAWSPPIS